MGKAIETYGKLLTFLGIEQNITDAEYEDIPEKEEENDLCD